MDELFRKSSVTQQPIEPEPAKTLPQLYARMARSTCSGLREFVPVPRCVILDFSGVPAEGKAHVEDAADYLVRLVTHYADNNGHKFRRAVKEDGLPADGLQALVEDGRMHIFTATEPSGELKEAKRSSYAVDVAQLLPYIQ